MQPSKQFQSAQTTLIFKFDVPVDNLWITLWIKEGWPIDDQKMRTKVKYDVGTIFKHPWVRDHGDKKPTTCIVTRTRNLFSRIRPDRTLSSWTGKLSEAPFDTHFVLRNALRTK